MCAVLTCYFLCIHCSFMSFTSCPLSSLALFFLYTVHLLEHLTLEWNLKWNVSKATHSFFFFAWRLENFNRCTVLACTKPKPSIFLEVYHALNVETVCLLLNCRCGNVAAILELDQCSPKVLAQQVRDNSWPVYFLNNWYSLSKPSRGCRR